MNVQNYIEWLLLEQQFYMKTDIEKEKYKAAEKGVSVLLHLMSLLEAQVIEEYFFIEEVGGTKGHQRCSRGECEICGEKVVHADDRVRRKTFTRYAEGHLEVGHKRKDYLFALKEMMSDEAKEFTLDPMMTLLPGGLNRLQITNSEAFVMGAKERIPEHVWKMTSGVMYICGKCLGIGMHHIGKQADVLRDFLHDADMLREEREYMALAHTEEFVARARIDKHLRDIWDSPMSFIMRRLLQEHRESYTFEAIAELQAERIFPHIPNYRKSQRTLDICERYVFDEFVERVWKGEARVTEFIRNSAGKMEIVGIVEDKEYFDMAQHVAERGCYLDSY